MTNPPTGAVIGCLLDVSGSMREALEAGWRGEKATERLLAVISAALRVARTESDRNPDALMFIGVFGLKERARLPAVVDLCSLVHTLEQMRNNSDGKSGHELLTRLAILHGRTLASRYIREKLSDEEAGIVYHYLKRNEKEIPEFLQAIPDDYEYMQNQLLLNMTTPFLNPLAAGLDMWEGGNRRKQQATAARENDKVENSEALRLARKIWDDWWQTFVDFKTRRTADVVDLLERLQESADKAANQSQSPEGEVAHAPKASPLLDTIRKYIYGKTPLKLALSKAKEVFDSFDNDITVQQRVLIVLSDGHWTDADPLEVAQSLTQPRVMDAKVHLAVVHLTGSKDVPSRRLYDGGDNADHTWDDGQRTLLNMATRVSALEHPIPVFASMGWEIPHSGEVALYATVHTTAALDEFCTMLLSARFGSADALLDIVGRTRLDDYVNNEHEERRMYPSDQGDSKTCYAHAAAAVIHMALSRVVIPRGQNHPTVETIRGKILEKFPAKKGGQDPKKVLDWITKETQYSPIRHFREVDEEGARKAVLRRRPVLATFGLSESGWDAFKNHFKNEKTKTSVLKFDEMETYCSGQFAGGHAVVLIGCGPGSLKFLNSWGSKWGDSGTFSIESQRVLSIESRPMRFYDVFWREGDLTEAHRQAYCKYIDKQARSLAADRPGYSVFEALCPLCEESIPVLAFTGSIHRAICPRCTGSFVPEPEHLIQALYVKAGLGKDNANDRCRSSQHGGKDP